ncbi:cyclopropane fatty acid synthase [Trametopsis cervina]|nr:cyclopropane fatty acid synthase [Trametopsis cervina]
MEAIHQPTWRSYVLSAGILHGTVLGLLTNYARSYILAVIQRGIVNGGLTIREGKTAYEFGNIESGENHVTVEVVRDVFWVRLFISHDLGLAEGYMRGDIEVSSMKNLLNLWLDNKSTLSALQNTLSSLFAYYSAVAINTLGQSITTSLHNVQVAYDTSNDLFQSFLSKEMMYSCALWSDEEDGVRGDLTVGPKPGDLEAAQLRKIRHILKQARVGPGSRLLEIGSGWGGMALEAARQGCTVHTVTLATEQKKMVEERAREFGLEDKITVHLCDYRQLPAEFKGSFDALVSCEMVEAVGRRHLPKYFKMIDWALKKDKAAFVVTATAQPEHRYKDYQPDDFARHYHWPNTHLPSATSFPVDCQAAVPGKFVLSSVEDHGIHYPRTLREWSRRFQASFKGKLVDNLKRKFPELNNPQNLEAFRRKWLYMFVYAEVGYARAYTSLNCWTFARPENAAEMCA